MKQNKKGLMVKFLVTVLLAIIIFAPACLFTSKMFRLSDQAQDNFNKLTKEINIVGKGQNGLKKTFVSIVDKGTAMVYFEPNQNQVKVAVDAAAPNTDYTILLNKPSACPAEGNCFCLFRKAEFDTTLWKPGYDTVTVTPTESVCDSYQFALRLDNCGIGKPTKVHSYSCTQGFMIERHLADESSWAVGSYYAAGRRQQIQMHNDNGVVVLKG